MIFRYHILTETNIFFQRKLFTLVYFFTPNLQQPKVSYSCYETVPYRHPGSTIMGGGGDLSETTRAVNRHSTLSGGWEGGPW